MTSPSPAAVFELPRSSTQHRSSPVPCSAGKWAAFDCTNIRPALSRRHNQNSAHNSNTSFARETSSYVTASSAKFPVADMRSVVPSPWPTPSSEAQVDPSPSHSARRAKTVFEISSIQKIIDAAKDSHQDVFTQPALVAQEYVRFRIAGER